MPDPIVSESERNEIVDFVHHQASATRRVTNESEKMPKKLQTCWHHSIGSGDDTESFEQSYLLHRELLRIANDCATAQPYSKGNSS